VLQAELAGRTDKSHRGFATIHYRNALEFDLHTHPDEASWANRVTSVMPLARHLPT
jgi:hypothetical protein